MVISLSAIINKTQNNNKQPSSIMVILGPTASGKTSLSLTLSQFIPIEIISADSRQIYKYMDIGTAKPTKEELSKVPHHFIDFLDPAESYSAGKFGDDANQIAKEIINRGNIPVVVGGSGLYIKSLCEGLFEEEKNDSLPVIREFLNKKLEEDGKEKMYQELIKIDLKAAEKYTDRNPRRIIRALEFYYAYGEPLSSTWNMKKTERDFNFFYFGICHNRERLYEIINNRCIQMWESGLIDETNKLLEMGYSPELNSMNTVGYKEALEYINGKLDESTALKEFQKNTRHYAKRQITWFNQIKFIRLNGDDSDKVKSILSIIKEKL